MKTNRILFETLLMILITVGGMFLLPQAKPLFAFVPIVYLLVEKRLRKRSWADLGFKFDTFREDLRTNWGWFALAGIVSQPLAAVLARTYLPEVFTHVKERLPFIPTGLGWLTFFLLMAISILIEEMTFRNFIQGRLTPFIGAPIAVLVSAALFAIVHFSRGTPAIVAFDLGSVFIDGVLFGIIYARSSNITITWLAHFIGNTLGLFALLML